MKRVVLTLDGVPLEFTFPAANGRHPFLLEVRNLRESARAGHLNNFGVGETPSIVFVLDNTESFVAGLIGRPLRARVDVFEDADFFFAGLVSALEYGRQILVTVDA